jgi:two-component system nitrogen regulation sensor histidine kinase NtrY
VRLTSVNDAYIILVRVVDPKVIGNWQHTADVVAEYRALESNRSSVQWIFAGLYAAVSLAILLAAIWLGLWAADRIVRPISRLISAAERVSEGDLKAQVLRRSRRRRAGLAGSRLQPHD